MADFFPPDDGDGASISSDPQAEARYTVHGQFTVNRLFSVPRMSRTIKPPAETMNRENPALEAQSEGNASNPAAGGTSSPRGSGASHIQLSFRPLAAESQVKDKIEEEMEEGEDASTSTESEPSEGKDGGFEAVLDTEARIPPRALEQEAMVTGLPPTKEPTALQEAPEKGEEEEEAPAPHLAAEKEPVVPQLPEEEETVVPLSVPDEEQKATLVPPEKKPSVPQPLPENEEKNPQLPPETEPSVPQLSPQKDQKVPQLPQETEPSVLQPLPESEEKNPQWPPETEPSSPGLPPETEPSVPQLSPQKDQKVPQLPQEMEPSVLQPLPESEQNVPQLPVETEPSVPHALPKRETPVPHPQVVKEPSLPQTAAQMEPPAPQTVAELEPAVPQTPVEVEPPVPQPLKETPALPLPPIAPRPPVIKELLALQSVPEKTVTAKEHIALRGTSPYRFERPAFQEEKGTMIPSETKVDFAIHPCKTPEQQAALRHPPSRAWPGREDTSTFVLDLPKRTPAAAPPGEKGASLNDTMEDLASHLRDVGNASKSAMASSISSFVASPVGQVFANTIDRALEKSEEWMDYYLPVLENDDEASTAAEEEHGTASEDLCKEGCFVRINSLSAKLRTRAFRLALHQLKTTRHTARENLPVLDQIIDVLDRARGQNLLNIASIPESLHNLWSQKGPKQEPPKSTKMLRTSSKDTPSIVPEQLELKALDLTRTLAQQLYGTYHDLLPHVADLPAHLQEKAIRVYENMEELQSHFTSSPSLRDLPSSLVIQSRQKMAVARENLDEILDFLAQNSAMNWLSQPASSSKGKQPTLAAVERQPKGRSPERTATEEKSTSRQPPSLPHF